MEANNANAFIRQAQSYGTNIAETRDKLKNLGSAFNAASIQAVFEKNSLLTAEQREKAEATAAFATAAGFIPQGIKEFGSAVKTLRGKFGRAAAQGTEETAVEGVDSAVGTEAGSALENLSVQSIRQSAQEALAQGAAQAGLTSGAETGDAAGIELAGVRVGTGAAEEVGEQVGARGATYGGAALARSAGVGPQVEAAFDANPELANVVTALRPPPVAGAGTAAVPGEALESIGAGASHLAPGATIGPQASAAEALDPELGAADLAEGVATGASAAEGAGGVIASGVTEAASEAVAAGAAAVSSAASEATAAALTAASTFFDFLGPIGILAGIITAGVELGTVLNQKPAAPGKPQAVKLQQSAQGRVQQMLAPSTNTAQTIQGGISAF